MGSSKRYSLVLPQQSVDRLEKMKELGEWPSDTEVFKRSIKLSEAMLKELTEGSIFYIKRKNDVEPIPFQPLM